MCGGDELEKMPRKKKGNNEALQLPSQAERHRTLKHLQETFADQIDPDVVYIVLSENEYNVEASVETLLTLASEYIGPTENQELPKSSDEALSKFEQLTGCKRLNASNSKQDKNSYAAAQDFSDIIYTVNPQITSGLYSGSQELYHSNEDLYSGNGVLDRIPSESYSDNKPEVKYELQENGIVNELSSENLSVKNQTTYAKVLKEVLSPQSDCSLEADASESIETSLDHNVNSPSSVTLPEEEDHIVEVNPSEIFDFQFDPLSVKEYQNSWSDFENHPGDLTWPIPHFANMHNQRTGPWRFRPPRLQLSPIEKITEKIQRGEKVLVVLRGLPGSGKSTLARKLTKGRGQICSTDNFFIRSSDLKYVFDPSRLQEAHEWNQRLARKAIENGVTPVVVDNTNVESWEMRPYVLCGKRCKYHIEIMEPDTAWKFNVNELARKNTHFIPKQKIASMLDRYDHNVTVDSILSNLPENHDCRPQAAARRPREPNPEPQRQMPMSRRNQQSVLFNATSDPAVQSLNTEFERLRLPKISKNHLQKSAAENVWEFCLNGEANGSGGIVENNFCEDPDFWQIDGGESQAEVCKTENEETVTSPRTRFRNRETQGDLKTVDDIVQASYQCDGFDSSLSGDLLDFETQNCEFDKKDAATETEPERSGALVLPKRKLAARFDQALLMDNLQTGVNWSIPRFPTDDPVPCNQNFEAPVELKTNGLSQADTQEDKRVVLSETNILKESDNLSPTDQPLGQINNVTEIVENHYKLLKELFPDTSDDGLWDLYKKCDGNIEWVTNLLLDSSHELPLANTDSHSNEPEETEVEAVKNGIDSVQNQDKENDKLTAIVDDTLNAAIEEALNLVGEGIAGNSDDNSTMDELFEFSPPELSESVVEGSSAESSETFGTTVIEVTEENRTSSNDCVKSETNSSVDLTAIELVSDEKQSEDVSFTLNPAFALQLEEMFGPANFPEASSLRDEKDLEVRIDMNLAWQIYNCWTQTIQRKQNEEDRMFAMRVNEKPDGGCFDGETSRVQENSQEIRKGSKEKERRRSRSCDSFEKSSTYQRVGKRDSVPDLKEIMDLEVALAVAKLDVKEEIERKYSNKTDLATKLKQKMLYEKFPHVEKSTLNEVFAANNFDFAQTEQEIGLEVGEYLCVPPNSPMPAKQLQQSQSLVKINPIVNIQATKSAEALLKPKSLELPPDIEELQDFRAEATLHYRLRQECFAKASEVYKSGMKSAAHFYAERGHMHSQKMREANRRASLQILLHQNLGSDSNTIDLHLLFINEALELLEGFLKVKINELQSGRDRKMIIRVITGRGAHSINEIPRIKHAVQEYLKRKKIRFLEKTSGLLEVTLTKKDKL